MSALNNLQRQIYANRFSSMPLITLLTEVESREEYVRFSERQVAQAKAIRALANRELKRRKRKEASA